MQLQDKSKVTLFLDDDPIPFASFEAPVNFELDTRKLVDGKHTLKIVSKDPGGAEGLKIIPFEVKNGPHIAIEGLKDGEVVDGVIPVMINAYGKGNAEKFYIEGSETPQSIPAWVWIILIGFAGWAMFYLIRYISMPAAV